ncbi:unnamed protein product [Clonostachys byssicola]|uniref:NACHT domain-containing protein n=1 Tax=Clonostachys byssicola TaxID=160290 RepID=A0A9N9UE52_9HYPO|nr:unnamed protein product [Clonostachys byssicola]
MGQPIQSPSGSVRQKRLHSKIDRLVSTISGTTLKSTFLHDVWPRLKGDYELMVSNLIAHCEKLVEERNISAKVDGRVKAAQSIDKTLDRRLQHRIENKLGDYTSVKEIFHDMHDLAGIRIVVDYPSQLELANKLIEETFEQAKKPSIFKKERSVGKRWDAWFGAYQSKNHHVYIKEGTQGTLEAYRDVIFEVQLTSLPESLYNKLAHPLLYKQQAGPLSSGDEMVIDLSHGLALCYSICLLYAQDKLENNVKPDQGLMSAMRSAAIDADYGQSENMSPLLSMMPDTVKVQLASDSTKESGSKVSTEVLTSTLSALPEQCPPEQLWTGFVEKMKGWDSKLEAVETAVKDQTEAFHQYHQDETDKKCLVDLRIINPSYQKKTIEKTKGGLLKGAYEWILRHPEYQRFRNDSTNRLLWVKGDPGKGKTMLLCGIIDDLEKESFAPVSYFFCEATQDNSLRCATAVLRTLIWRLCTSWPRLVSRVREKYDTEGKEAFEGPGALFALEEIMANILQDLRCSTVTLVIDALDECSQHTMRDLIRLIVDFSRSFEAKWIVSSRNWPMIEEQFKLAEKVKVSLELNKDSVSHAVKLFINDKVAQLAERKDYNITTKAHVLDILRDKANDTFLWVALVCAELSKPQIRSWNTIDILNSIPAGLEELYKRMITQVLSSINSSRCKQLLATACIAARPLSFRELPTLIPELKSFKNEQIEELIGECGSFLSAQGNHVHFVHQSAQDFLVGPEGRVFQSTIQGHHLQLFRQSMRAMQTLKRNMYGGSSPGVVIDEISRNENSPFYTIEYCCLHWVDHLNLASHERKAQDDDLTCTFFKTKVLYWVEALCFHGYAKEGISAVQKLGSIANSDELKGLSEDLRRFWLTFREALDVAPLQVYGSALLFAPTSSLIRNSHGSSIYPWVTLRQSSSQDPSESWGLCISTLEVKRLRSFALSTDGQHLIYGHGPIRNHFGLRLWDFKSKGYKHSVSTSHSIESVAISFDGRHVAVAVRSDDPREVIALLDSDLSPTDIQLSLTDTYFKEGNNFEVWSLAFSPDGTQIAAGLKTGSVLIWDLATGALVHKLVGDDDGAASSITYSADGNQLAVTREHATVWDLVSGRYLFSTGYCDGGVVFLPGSKLATAKSSEILIWDLEKVGHFQQSLRGTSTVRAIASLDLPGLLFASASFSGVVKIWDQACNCVKRLLGHTGPVTSLSFSPEKGILASDSWDKTIRLWDITRVVKMSQTPRQVARNAPRDESFMAKDSQSHSGQVRAVEFSPNGKWLASAADDRRVKIWDIPSLACVWSLTPRFAPLQSSVFQFSPDSRWLVLKHQGDNNSYLSTIWDMTSLEPPQAFSFNDDKKNDYYQILGGFSPNGRLISLYKYGATRLVDLKTKGMVQHFQFPLPTQISSFYDLILTHAYSSDSQILVLVSDSLARAYKISTGEELWSIEHNMSQAPFIALSRDSTHFAMVSDQELHVWKVNKLPPRRLCELQFAERGVFSGHDWKLAINRRWLVFCESSRINTFDLETHTYRWRRTGGIITSVSFDTLDENCFHTNAGSWTIDKKGYVKPTDYGFSADGVWITLDSKRLLWLPPQYRGVSACVRGDTVALGSASGSVAVLHFTM